MARRFRLDGGDADDDAGDTDAGEFDDDDPERGDDDGEGVEASVHGGARYFEPWAEVPVDVYAPAEARDQQPNVMKWQPQLKGDASGQPTASCFYFFNLLLTRELLTDILNCTNEVGVERTPDSWAPYTLAELYTFLAILIIMGIAPLPRVRDHWAQAKHGQPHPGASWVFASICCRANS